MAWMISLLAAGAAACGLATPQHCSSTNVLINKAEVRSELDRLAAGRSAALLHGREAPVAEQLLEVLGGPPEEPVKAGPYLLFAACRAHSCDEKGAMLVGERGDIAGAAILYFGCSADGAPLCDTADRLLAIFVAGPIPSPAHRELLQWGASLAGAGTLSRVSVERAPARPTATLDFDADGKADRVLLKTEDGVSRLVAHRGGAAYPGVVIAQVRDPGNFYMRVLPPGTYRTACGMGLGPDDAPCPAASVTLTRPTIGYGTAEASLLAAEWNGDGFSSVALSD